MSTSGTLEPETMIDHREYAAKWKWVGLVISLLALQVTVGGFAIYLANSDPSHSIVPNYHQQALEYDQVLANRQSSQKLGWTWSITPSNQLTPTGKRAITVQLRDAAGKPITNAIVTLQVTHHARGNNHQNITLFAEDEAPGTYRGEALLERNGVWQVDLVAQGQKDRFTDRRESYWSFSKP